MIVNYFFFKEKKMNAINQSQPEFSISKMILSIAFGSTSFTLDFPPLVILAFNKFFKMTLEPWTEEYKSTD